VRGVALFLVSFVGWYVFFLTKILQGSVATGMKCGEICKATVEIDCK